MAPRGYTACKRKGARNTADFACIATEASLGGFFCRDRRPPACLVPAPLWSDKNFVHFDEGDLKEVKVELESSHGRRRRRRFTSRQAQDQPFPF
jgi:hypothetical protein